MENDAGHGCSDAKICSSSSALPAVPQCLGIPVEEYLARADKKTLLPPPPLTSNSSSLLCGSGKNNDIVVIGDLAPESFQQVVGDEPRSWTDGKSVVKLHHLCQQTRGLVPLFEIECDEQGATWGGRLIVGDRIISRGEMRWHSEKAAREGLAEVGVGVVRDMMKNEDGKANNWTGMLQAKKCLRCFSLRAPKSEDYHAASTTGGPIYKEVTLLGSCFACICTIPARPSTPFGSLTAPFLSKKAARVNAAREAMQFLISQDLTPLFKTANSSSSSTSSSSLSYFSSSSFASSSFYSSSSSSAKNVAQIKKPETGASDREVCRTLLASFKAEDSLAGDTSYILKVLKLCSLLQLPHPIYRLAPNPLATVPNILAGAAYFPESAIHRHPLLVGPVGEVRNVFGKKNAKEKCARGVFQVLIKIITTSAEKDLLGGGGEG